MPQALRSHQLSAASLQLNKLTLKEMHKVLWLMAES